MTSYELIFHTQTEYLYVLVSGELNENTDQEIDARIKIECEKLDRNKVLIDIRESSSRLSLLENYVAATSYRQRMGTYTRAIAIVDSKEHKENSELFELAATNSGARLKFFTSTVEAEKWLIEKRD
jgi:hypothetical protein